MTGAPATGPFVLAVDSGGSGLRIALTAAGVPGEPPRAPAARLETAEPVRTGPSGIDADHLLAQLLPAARELLTRTGATGIRAACVGAAGMATLGEGLRAALPEALATALGVRRLALAADTVTAYAGALGERTGVVVAAGTGLMALGTDLRSWRRADGWGHLLGDCGGGAWIGRSALEAALRAHDGREGGSAALLASAERFFGPAPGLPGQVYPRTDRPAVLASFAPEVARCATAPPQGAGDEVAERILREAAREIACSAAAACPDAGESSPASEVALAGGLLRLGAPLLDPLAAELSRRLPHARSVPAAGDPLDGALLVAARLATDTLRLPPDPRLLSVHGA